MNYKMTIANKIKQTIEENNPSCFTLYGGYMGLNGKTIRFPTGSQEIEKRNDKGRVTMARYRYADNSVLEYKCNESTGYKFSVK